MIQRVSGAAVAVVAFLAGLAASTVYWLTRLFRKIRWKRGKHHHGRPWWGSGL